MQPFQHFVISSVLSFILNCLAIKLKCEKLLLMIIDTLVLMSQSSYHSNKVTYSM